MAVITRFIVVRNGVELDKVFEDRKEAEAYDKMLDAADNLAAFIKAGDLQIGIDGNTIDALSVFLAKNAPEVTRILKGIKPLAPPTDAATNPTSGDPAEFLEKKKRQAKEPKPADKKK
jgi:uncharacterized protein